MHCHPGRLIADLGQVAKAIALACQGRALVSNLCPADFVLGEEWRKLLHREGKP